MFARNTKNEEGDCVPGDGGGVSSWIHALTMCPSYDKIAREYFKSMLLIIEIGIIYAPEIRKIRRIVKMRQSYIMAK